MLPLREATANRHKEAEQMPFNIQMFKGELTEEQYLTYLNQQLAIFKTIENKGLPSLALARASNIQEDIDELVAKGNISDGLVESTKLYTDYLNSLDAETVLPHVYLNYLAIAYGGQLMKKQVPSAGNMYNFDNKKEAIQSVRAVQKDEWAEEVNKAYDYIIAIFKDLEPAQ